MGVRIPPPLPENSSRRAVGRGHREVNSEGPNGRSVAQPREGAGPRMADEITLQKNYWKQVRGYFEGVRTEMKRVTWPGRQEVYGTTVMVILSTFLFAAYFALCDYGFRGLVQRVLDMFLHHR